MPNLGTIGGVYMFVTMRCIICGEEIHGRYLVDYWHQAIHDFHKVEYCFSCGRFVRPDSLHLADGRIICGVCSVGIVSAVRHIDWVEKRVRDLLKLNGIEDIPKNIPIEIVNAFRMAKLRHASTVDINHYGLTQTAKMFSLLKTHYNHAIYILDSLPKIFFAGVLAHEFLHAWQNEHGLNLSPSYCEGFCNLGSYVVYQAINVDLSRYYIKRLEEDVHPIYGDGFRKVRAVYEKVGGLRQTMSVLQAK